MPAADYYALLGVMQAQADAEIETKRRKEQGG